MRWLDEIHDRYVLGRRARRLSDHLAAVIPRDATVLDVGSGDGGLARRVAELRPDVSLRGVDVLVRGDAAIPVEPFDGARLPFADARFDVVMFIDVLHHTRDPLVLLREARRVACGAIVIKDHLREGPLAGVTLRFMDRVGNRRHGVSLPYNYWRRRQWTEAFRQLELEVDLWNERLHLYPWPARPVFERSLHFLARLRVG